MLNKNLALKSKILNLVKIEPIVGKVLEGDKRLNDFREILENFFNLIISLDSAILEIEQKLKRSESIYYNNNRVFPSGWAERLIRTQISRFYNQAVLTSIIEKGDDSCTVEQSLHEQPDSKCSQQLVGTIQSANIMLSRLKLAYGEGNWNNDLKLPDHPHCTHTFVPIK